MSETKRKPKGQPVPYAVERPDRIPSRRYYDEEFYQLERERLWPRVWQMACRLEEIPNPGDFSVYEIFDQSVIVTRVDASTIKAYHNHCRHRGVKLASDRGCANDGFTCPFHGWKWANDGKCTFVYTPNVFEKDQLKGKDLALRECRVETWGGCAFINFDDAAPPLRQCLEPFATAMDAWKVEQLRVEWWLAAKLPVNWKLAMEAFHEGYHVMQTHPQLLTPGVPPEKNIYAELGWDVSPASPWATVPAMEMPASVPSRAIVDLNLYFYKTLNVGMAGMMHEKDVRTAETLRDIQLPSDPIGASMAFRRALNEAVMKAHRAQGMDIPDLHAVDANRHAASVNFCFPHFYLLPIMGSASSYRVRPLGPEECLFELWSLTRYPPGVNPPPIKTPTPMAHDDPRWPPIPQQDFANLPLQQRGLRTRGFEFMRLSNQVEGLIGNNHQLIDGYLAGLGYDELLPGHAKVNGRIDVPTVDLGL